MNDPVPSESSASKPIQHHQHHYFLVEFVGAARGVLPATGQVRQDFPRRRVRPGHRRRLRMEARWLPLHPYERTRAAAVLRRQEYHQVPRLRRQVCVLCCRVSWRWECLWLSTARVGVVQYLAYGILLYVEYKYVQYRNEGMLCLLGVLLSPKCPCQLLCEPKSPLYPCPMVAASCTLSSRTSTAWCITIFHAHPPWVRFPSIRRLSATAVVQRL